MKPSRPEGGSWGRLFSLFEKFSATLHTLEWAWKFLALAGLGSGLGISVWGYLSKNLFKDLLGIGILLFFIGCLVWKRVFSVGKTRTDNPFVIETNRLMHFFVGRARCGQHILLKLRALRGDCHAYWIQFHWTGSGSAELSSPTAGVSITGPHPRSGRTLTYFCLLFETPIPRDRERAVEIKYVLQDPELNSSPHISVLAVSNRKRITIRADFPTGTKPSVFLQERLGEYLHDPHPYKFAEGSHIAIYQVDKPKRNATYSIAWEKSYVRSLPSEIDDFLPSRMEATIEEE